MHITRTDYKYRIYDNRDYMNKNKNRKFIKLYLLEPEFIDTGEKFHKFGITHHYKAENRLHPTIGNDKQYNLLKQPVRVLASAYLPVEVACEKETYFKNKFLKNIYIDIQFNGVSEMLLLDKDQRMESIKEIRAIHEEFKHTWKKEPQLNTCKGYWDEYK